MSKPFRLHGHPPYTIIAIHGGPGAVGEARPFAEELANYYGVVEPFLLAETFEDQVDELKNIIEKQADMPVVLAGHSYGAMLAYIFASRYPEFVKKLIMISSGLLKEKDVAATNATRLSRLTPAKQTELETARAAYKQSTGNAKKQAFVKLFTLIQQADSYDPLPHGSDLEVIRPKLYDSAWEGMQALRSTGKLARYGKHIVCPVVAIHGGYDPRQASSIKASLEANVKDCEFILLENCGHYPWYEKEARDEFFGVLRRAAE